MRRLFVLAALLAIVCYGKAQNVQLHYDFGGALYDKDLHGRPVLTSTVEMFKVPIFLSTGIIPAKELRPAIGRLPANCVSGNLLFPYMSNITGEHRAVSPIITPILAVQPIPGIIRILRKVSRLPLCINISRNIGSLTISS